MIQMPGPGEWDADVIAVDLALDALARRRPIVTDPALAALADFAHIIDARAAGLGPERTTARPAGLNGNTANTVSLNGSPVRPSAPKGKGPSGGRHTQTRLASRTRLRHALLAIPVAAVAIMLAGTLPINGSPGSPLYPLHQLIFQPDQPTPESVRLSLASASQALDHATSNGSTRAADLDQARRHLAEARKQLAQVTGSDTRTELEAELSNLERRAIQLADDTDHHGGPADKAGPGQDERHGQGDTDATPGPTSESQNGQDQPTANPHDTEGRH
jgi:hypothetical protein